MFFTHVIHNARVNDNVIALTRINKVLWYCMKVEIVLFPMVPITRFWRLPTYNWFC